MTGHSLAIEPQTRKKLNSVQVASQLAAIDVHFLQVDDLNNATVSVNPEDLIISLSSSNEARIRLALIPLLLRHPGHSVYVQASVVKLPFDNQITLKCYYTAAHFLQQKYALQLEQLFGWAKPLPDFFTCELELSPPLSYTSGLQVLAERHRQLSGRTINWLGTYEHGAKRFLASCKYKIHGPTLN